MRRSSMTDNIKYAEFKLGIATGSSTYLEKRNIKKSFGDNTIFSHEKAGRIRAEKAHGYANAIDETNHSLLLALMLAIFNSSSERFALYIAEYLIKGELSIKGTYQNTNDTKLKHSCTLESTAFSEATLFRAARSRDNFKKTADTSEGPTLGFNKRAAVWEILNNSIPSSTEQPYFISAYNFFVKELSDTTSNIADITSLHELKTS